MSVKGSFSVHFTWDGSDPVLLNTDITAIGAYGVESEEEDEGYLPLSLLLSVSIGKITVETRLDNSTVDAADYDIGGATLLAMWVFIYSNAISIYCNGRWIYSYVMSFTKYVAYTTVASLVTSATLTDIRREEIPDWRDAVFVDYEATGDGALQSVIQQRPIWTFPAIDRVLSFTYHAIKDTLTAIRVHNYNNEEVNPADLSSDGLVNYYDVGVSSYALAAEEIGLVTRLYRLSELDIGGIEAARTIQEIALEHSNPIDGQMRLDPRIEISDLLHFDLICTGTGTHIEDDAIVENVEITLQDGVYNQHITGRRNK
jgi:hypothetical protein